MQNFPTLDVINEWRKSLKALSTYPDTESMP